MIVEGIINVTLKMIHLAGTLRLPVWFSQLVSVLVSVPSKYRFLQHVQR